MTSTARKRAAAREAAPTPLAPFAPLGILADLGRQQMCVAAEASSAMMRGFETIRRIQLHAVEDLTGAALEMQVEMMGCASHLIDSETALESASAFDAFDALPGMKALFPFMAPPR